MNKTAPDSLASGWLAQLVTAIDGNDWNGATELFGEECYWRDLVSLTWNITTAQGREPIAKMLAQTVPQVRPTAWQVDSSTVSESPGMLEFWFRFETAVGRGRGHVRLRDGKCWTMTTTLRELKGFEEKRGPNRPLGTEHKIVRGRRSWLEQREQEAEQLGLTEQPYCLIIGGGQGGLGLGARLRQLGVPAIIVERNQRAGDSWRKRYRSLCLHDPVWYDHMPYLPFPDHWPVFSPKDKIGDWLEMYAKVMELNYWSGTECNSARFDEAQQRWEVQVTREGEPVTLYPRQLVLATGMSGMPHVPEFPGRESFRGKQCHSSAFTSGADWAGKRCVVVGSNNSAHDICADLWEHGAQVTMLQRSSTMVARTGTLMDLGWGRLFSEQALARGIDTETADLMMVTSPYAILPQVQQSMVTEMKRRDAAFYKRLTDVGFMLDFGDDGTGLALKYLRRGSGYYIDTGASELICDGRIGLRSGVQIERITEDAVVLDDGSRIECDLIIYATGFGSMNGWAAKMISQEVADRVGKCWGLGSDTSLDPGPWEGELRNMWKPTRQPALWFHGGNLQQSRSYSLYLALQLKARMEGLETPVYGLPQVHHLS
jgi:putative flavoprotein involved in K+ transport